MDRDNVIFRSQEQWNCVRIHDALLGEDLAKLVHEHVRQLTKLLDVSRVMGELFNAKLLKSLRSLLRKTIKAVTFDLASAPSTHSRRLCSLLRSLGFLGQRFATGCAQKSSLRSCLAVWCDGESLSADIAIL